jgi:hypothetical protein
MPLLAPDPKSRFSQGYFMPKNTQKYIGKVPLVWRSSWELRVMQMFDDHPSVLQWSSESISIPYFNPLTKKNSLYYPDFFVVYTDRHGHKHGEVVEIKPSTHTDVEKAKKTYEQLQLVLNTYKWQAAEKWCAKRGLKFRVLTEEQLFAQGTKKLGAKYIRKKPRKTPSIRVRSTSNKRVRITAKRKSRR